MHLSPYFANKIVRWLAGHAMPTAPTGLYIGLWNGNPLSGGVEVGGTLTGGAARIALPFADPADDGSANVLVSNDVVDFGVAAAGATISHVTLHDAVSAGNILAVRPLGAPRAVAVNDQVRIQSNDYSLTIVKAA